jgi:hypothetical protein
MNVDNVQKHIVWPIKKFKGLVCLSVAALFICANPAHSATTVKCNTKERTPFYREKFRIPIVEGGKLIATEYYYINNNHELKAYVDASNYLNMYKIDLPENGLGYGTPTGYKWGKDWKDIFVVGKDHAVWINFGADHWNSLGGIATSNPAAINTSWSNEVYVRGKDRAIWVNYKNDWESGDFGGWEFLGGQSLGAPFVSRYGNKGGVQVRVCGLDNKLWVRYRKAADGYSWGLWQHLKKR